MRRYLFLLWAGFLFVAMPCGYAFEVKLTDTKGFAVKDAAILLKPTSFKSSKPTVEPGVEILQQDELFNPFVRIVPMGTTINFPNLDRTAHHVYSFSKAKRFQIPLYHKGTEEEVTFDQPGIVVLGCNIHDWMLGYVVISDTPYFAKSDKTGIARFSDLPKGRYDVFYWYPNKINQDVFVSKGSVTIPNDALYEISIKNGTYKRQPKRPLQRYSE